jgi:Xaa-Pro aminopeptidase
MRKDAQEIALIQENADIADEAMRAAYRAVRVGVTERDIAAAATEAFRAADVDSVNFTIVASGPNGAYPHHHTGRRELHKGDAVVIDIGARKNNYNSDITRMAYIGTPNKTYRRVHMVVEEAVKFALETVRPGVRASEVDRAARQVIERAGYGEYFVHRTGHGLGLTGHEPPYLTETSDVILNDGMVFSIEPGVYLPGKFGVRLEEIVAVTSTGVRIFSHLSRDLHQVPA